jgi:glyoxylase I family protein
MSPDVSETIGKPGDVEIGIVVRDLATMTRFYGDAVGLPHVVDLPVEGGLMRRFASGGSIVKLVLMDHSPNGSNPPGGVPGATGLRWFTIVVDDIEGVTQRCETAGARVVYPIQTAANGAVFTILDDPEGNWLELVAT